MPRVIDIEDSASCSLEECIAGLDALGFDPGDEGRLTEGARWLRRLGNNQHFLGDMLVRELEDHGQSELVDSAYSPQSLMLSGFRPGYFLRANIWPAKSDPVYRASGAGTFAYGLAHDHNFDFLTLGYHGPGYESDYWEYDYAAVTGLPGEAAGLRFTGRRTLTPCTILHYRAHRDVHAQWPPEKLSVSLNVMATNPAQGWYDQYAFDPANDTIARVLSPNSTEVFLRLAVALGSGAADHLARHLGATHPSDRLRMAAFEARAEQVAGLAEADAVWREAERSGSRMVATLASQRRRELA